MPAIKYKERTYAGSSFPVLEMTKAEYDALSEAKKMDGTVYMITDGTGSWAAEDSAYDNTQSGLTATNVQDALDELNSKTLKVVTQTIHIGDVAADTAGNKTVNITVVPSGHRAIGICGWNVEGSSGLTGIIISKLYVSENATQILLTYRASIAAVGISVVVIILYD